MKGGGQHGLMLCEVITGRQSHKSSLDITFSMWLPAKLLKFRSGSVWRFWSQYKDAQPIFHEEWDMGLFVFFLIQFWKLYKDIILGFPHGPAVKNLPANARNMGSIPGLRRFPGEESGDSPQYSCMANPMDRNLVGYSPWGSQNSWTRLAKQQRQWQVFGEGFIRN